MSVESKKTRNVNVIGPTGKQVAMNVKRLRGGMTYKELSQRMADVGREITVLGLRRIESFERKVDVDDLMAFAVVFGVSPLTLLLPEYASRSITTKITGYPKEVGSNVVWLWARGEEPLEVSKGNLSEGNPMRDREIAVFRLRSIPEIESRTEFVSATGWVPEQADDAKKEEEKILKDALRLSDAQLVKGND